MKNTIAIDQYGQTYHNLGNHPRKTLLEQLGYSNASKMYVDDKDGNAKHIGYVIGGLWLRIYQLTDWNK